MWRCAASPSWQINPGKSPQHTKRPKSKKHPTPSGGGKVLLDILAAGPIVHRSKIGDQCLRWVDAVEKTLAVNSEW
jgi:hypothetical protein